jgi:hypothetical protein
LTPDSRCQREFILRGTLIAWWVWIISTRAAIACRCPDRCGTNAYADTPTHVPAAINATAAINAATICAAAVKATAMNGAAVKAACAHASSSRSIGRNARDADKSGSSNIKDGEI